MTSSVAHCHCLCLSPQLSLKCRAPEVSQYVYQMYDSVLKNWPDPTLCGAASARPQAAVFSRWLPKARNPVGGAESSGALAAFSQCLSISRHLWNDFTVVLCVVLEGANSSLMFFHYFLILRKKQQLYFELSPVMNLATIPSLTRCLSIVKMWLMVKEEMFLLCGLWLAHHVLPNLCFFSLAFAFPLTSIGSVCWVFSFYISQVWSLLMGKRWLRPSRIFVVVTAVEMFLRSRLPTISTRVHQEQPHKPLQPLCMCQPLDMFHFSGGSQFTATMLLIAPSLYLFILSFFVHLPLPYSLLQHCASHTCTFSCCHFSLCASPHLCYTCWTIHTGPNKHASFMIQYLKHHWNLTVLFFLSAFFPFFWAAAHWSALTLTLQLLLWCAVEWWCGLLCQFFLFLVLETWNEALSKLFKLCSWHYFSNYKNVILCKCSCMCPLTF